MMCYPEYKESGVEWIGEIPKHWETKAVWMMFHLGRGRVISNEEIGNNPGQYPVYSSQTENEGIMGYIDTYDFDGNYITWTTDGAKAGTVFYRTGQFNCTNVCGTLLPKNQDLDLRFFRHALNIVTSQFVRYDINPKLMNNVMAKIRVQVPSKTEQTQIANFLDHKTEQIDELIRIKERQIELLHEQRTALINQVVTKGLDPNVDMKPSGVEWIGEIPGHWEVRRNKRIFNERDDRSTTGEEELLTVSHITGVSPRAEKKNVGMFLAETMEGYKHCSVGNLVINTMWAWMGALGISSFDGIVSPSYNVYELKSSEYLPRYYDYLYRTPNHVNEIIRWSKGIWTSRWRLYPDAFFSMFTITPPFTEQVQIANFLNCKTEQIDELITTEQQKIKLLKEYRQSLISEAVTGKIDIRNEV